jgi:hypothetical protein
MKTYEDPNKEVKQCTEIYQKQNRWKRLSNILQITLLHVIRTEIKHNKFYMLHIVQ